MATTSRETLTRKAIIQKLQAGVRALRQVVEPEFVVLFGSYAYGEPHPDSDVDLLLILPDGTDPETASRASQALRQCFGKGLEIHSATLSEWRGGLLKRNWFLAEIVQRGQPIFSRRPWSEVLEEVETLMNQSQNLYPFEWLDRAEDDWATVNWAIGEGRIFLGAYHLQQAVEKWLKAFLLAQGWQLERTHELENLLNEVVQYDSSLERFRAMCHRVNYFIAARYPGLPQPPTEDELRQQWLPQAADLRAYVRQALGLQTP